MTVTIKVRSGTAAAWTSANPTLAAGEIGYETDTYKFKFGSGSTAWNSLAYYISAVAAHTHAAADITSGTFADARIAASNVTQHQAALAIACSQLTGTLPSARFADDTIALSRLTYIGGPHVVGRQSGTLGAASALTMATLRSMLAYPASEVSFSNGTSGLAATTVQAALDEIDAAVDALAVAAPTITTLDLAGASTANFPSGAVTGDRWIVINAHASGTTLGSSNQIVVMTNDALIAKVNSASTTNGADWHKVDNTDAVQSVAGKTGAVTLAASDVTSGTFHDARISLTSVEQYEADLDIDWTQLLNVPATFPPSAHTLDSHSNVTITSNTANEILQWSGSAWINRTLAEAGIAAASHVHSAADLTSGTLPNARVAAGNVTQHQAALAILGSQLSGTIDGGAP